MSEEIFILTTGPIERLGGMERFLQYVASGFRERGYGVRVFHAENTGPERWQHPNPHKKLECLLAGGLHGYYIGKAAKAALHPGVKLVLSNSTVGWYPIANRAERESPQAQGCVQLPAIRRPGPPLHAKRSQ